MRDRLIELLKSPHKAEQLRQMGVTIGKYEDDCVEAMIADFLLANSVIVPPCKVGDSLWDIRSWANSRLSIINRTIEEVKVERIIFDEFGIGIETEDATYFPEHFGDLIFLTREEAEVKLRELKGADNEH